MTETSDRNSTGSASKPTDADFLAALDRWPSEIWPDILRMMVRIKNGDAPYEIALEFYTSIGWQPNDAHRLARAAAMERLH